MDNEKMKDLSASHQGTPGLSKCVFSNMHKRKSFNEQEDGNTIIKTINKTFKPCTLWGTSLIMSISNLPWYEYSIYNFNWVIFTSHSNLTFSNHVTILQMF